ncbi:Uncharacterized protein HZ326_30351 [Fusarium oxysporum f. sp. albedinis]|nr:Uncharacterized protein HZ326_30351 [Fusarium oxysporum f. sp. albedinis]
MSSSFQSLNGLRNITVRPNLGFGRALFFVSGDETRRNFGEFTFSDNTFVGSNGGTSEPERLRYRRTVPVASVATSSRSTTPIAMGFFPL